MQQKKQTHIIANFAICPLRVEAQLKIGQVDDEHHWIARRGRALLQPKAGLKGEASPPPPPLSRRNGIHFHPTMTYDLGQIACILCCNNR